MAEFSNHRIHDQMVQALREAYEQGFKDGIAHLAETAKGLAHAPPEMLTHSGKKAFKLKIGHASKNRKLVLTVPRGTTEKHIERAFLESAPKSLSPTQAIRVALETGAENIAETSARRAIERLEKRGVIERIPGTVTWRAKKDLRPVSIVS